MLTALAVGVGFTSTVAVIGAPGQPLAVGVMVNVITGPVHPFADGVTVIVPEIGTAPGLVATNDGIFPVPLAPSPIAMLVLVHV